MRRLALTSFVVAALAIAAACSTGDTHPPILGDCDGCVHPVNDGGTTTDAGKTDAKADASKTDAASQDSSSQDSSSNDSGGSDGALLDTGTGG